MADLLGGGFLGVNALVLLAAYAGTMALRPLAGRRFVRHRVVGICHSVCCGAPAHLDHHLVPRGAAADLSPGVSGTVFAVGAYPLLATLFARTQRALLR